MLKTLFVCMLLLSGMAHGQYSDTLSCSGGNLEYVIHYNQQQCSAMCDGRYSIEILTGIGPFNYTITGPSGYSHSNFEDSLLCVGAYNIQIEDIGQAITCNTSIQVQMLTAMTFTSGVTSTTGGGACDGEAWISVAGGVPSYTYVWYDAGQNVIPGETDSILINACAGVYYVKAFDNAINCQDTTGFVQLTIPNPPLNVIVTMTYEEVCPGSCDAGFDYMVTGGSGNYTIQWNGFGIGGGGQVYPTCPVDGVLEVWDDAGGYASAFVFFNQWPGVTIFPSVTDESCSGLCDGNIFFDDQWSPGVDQYSIDGGVTYQTSPTFNNLCPSTYSLYAMVSDAYGGWGCQIDLGMFTIQSGGANPLVVSEVVSDNTCLTDCNGTGELTVTANTGAYTVDWYDDLGALIGVSDSIDSLCGGVYDYTVTDPSGCTYSDSMLILDPPVYPPLNYTLTTTNVTATGLCDGTATITITGGLAPYTIIWYDANQVPIPNESAATIDSLCVGSYFVSFYDSQSGGGGCGIGAGPGSGGLIPFSINEPLSLILTFEQLETCPFSCDAIAYFQAFGGTGNYMYDLDGMFSANGEFYNLCPGVYSVTVTDDMGDYATISYQVDPMPFPSVVVQNTDETCLGACNGTIDFLDPLGEAMQFSVDGGNTWSASPLFIDLCPGNYDCFIMTWNGCPIPINNLTVLSGPVYSPTLAFGITDELCFESCDGMITLIDSAGEAVQFSIGGGFVASNVFTGICAGTYDAFVQNAEGCEAVFPSVISVGQPDSISISTQVSISGCNYPCNGELLVSAIGGTGILEYSIDGVSWNTTGYFNGLCPGLDTVNVRDANGCENIIAFEILPMLSLSVNTTVNIDYSGVMNCTGDIVAVPSGGLAPYIYKWKDCESGTVSNETINPIDLCPGAYFVEVTDANGCTVSSTPCDTIQSIAGIKSLATIDWSIYPNPTNSELNIRSYNGLSFSASIVDLKGREITHLETDDDYLQINMYDYNVAPGSYFVILRQNGNISRKRIIVQ